MSNKNNWYERGDLPTENEMVNYGGEEFEVLAYRDWEGELLAVLYNHSHGFAKHVEAKPISFRPIRTERDKLVEKAERAIENATGQAVNSAHIHALIEANWRPIKQQTEHEFVSECLKFMNLGFSAATQNALCEMAGFIHRAGCRFIEQGE